jgi:hypothetical protein
MHISAYVRLMWGRLLGRDQVAERSEPRPLGRAPRGRGAGHGYKPLSSTSLAYIRPQLRMRLMVLNPDFACMDRGRWDWHRSTACQP